MKITQKCTTERLVRYSKYDPTIQVKIAGLFIKNTIVKLFFNYRFDYSE